MSDGSDSNANFNYAIFLRPVVTITIARPLVACKARTPSNSF